ncbi:MAG TPA: YgeY family selenium metabolism-linked hydrolase [Negativicutes bacterium]|nr:YgeY family selenium metabolism-linked hydrolase [Negativicutes bacterium]
MNNKLLDTAATLNKDMLTFTQTLIQTPSLSGEEKAVAELCKAKMIQLDYDEVFIDGIGNVVGIIRGSGEGCNLMYNSHLDHVDPGNAALWDYPPYGGVMDGGYIHGRAASDVKGGLAAQIYAGALLRQAGIQLRGDYIVTGVVQEEPAEMFGIQFLCDQTFPARDIHFDLMISSEATGLNLFLGHRGRVELEVVTEGRTSHGSAPWRGINAVTKMMSVLEQVNLLAEALPTHPVLGQSTLALTNITCSPGRLSIIPDVCTISLDRRLLPEESCEAALSEIETILSSLSQKDPEFKAHAQIRTIHETSWTGLSADCAKKMSAWFIRPDHPLIIETVKALNSIGQTPDFGKWDFATDASYVTGVLGIPTVGYSPMEEQYAHTPQDRVSTELMFKALCGNAAIAQRIAG